MTKYFEELIELMELLDSNNEKMEEDDTKIPAEIMEKFNNDNDYYVDVSILERMIDNSISIPSFCRGEKYITLKGAELHNERLTQLERNYLTVYLPTLKIFDLGTTLKKDFNNK